MNRPRYVHAFAGLLLVACGIDVMGIAPESGEVVGGPDGSAADAPTGGNETGAKPGLDGAADAPLVVTDPPDGSDADADAGKPDAEPADANVCASCPAGTARAMCTSVGCAAGHRVFVSSTKYQGDLQGAAASGPAGADAKCQGLAQAAGLGGTWRAWLSSSGSEPASRFNKASAPYRLLDGTAIANDWNGLKDGSIAALIHLDENRAEVNAGNGGEAWTGTDYDGVYSGLSCQGFTSNLHGDLGDVGLVTLTNAGWSNQYNKNCDSNLRLYCFEQ